MILEEFESRPKQDWYCFLSLSLGLECLEEGLQILPAACGPESYDLAGKTARNSKKEHHIHT